MDQIKSEDFCILNNVFKTIESSQKKSVDEHAEGAPQISPICFGSDNFAGASPEVLHALKLVNDAGDLPSYGSDPYTRAAVMMIRNALALSERSYVYFVHTGTAANILALRAVLRSHQSVICSPKSHLVTHEVGALAAITGSSVLQTVSHNHGKITPADIKSAHAAESAAGFHSTRPRVVSIAQPTELGTIYKVGELKEIADTCKTLGLLLHIDGCRIYNAAASLGCSLAEFAIHADILSLGGTKNGLLQGEAVVFVNPEMDSDLQFPYIHKQCLQLQSKMRFLSAQYIALFSQNLWLRNADHANAMARRIADGIVKFGSVVKTVAPVQTNMLFLTISSATIISELVKEFIFYVMDKQRGLVRIVTSFNTRVEDVDCFLSRLSELLSKTGN